MNMTTRHRKRLRRLKRVLLREGLKFVSRPITPSTILEFNAMKHRVMMRLDFKKRDWYGEKRRERYRIEYYIGIKQ